MDFVRIVDLTGWLRWDVLAADPPVGGDTAVNAFQTVEGVSLCFRSLRSAYPRTTFRLGGLDLSPDSTFEDLVASVRSRRRADPEYTPFGRDPVGELLAAIEDDWADAVWMYGAGHPSDVEGAEKEVGQMLIGLTDRRPPGAVRDRERKPLIGYCGMSPLLLHAHELGLVRSIHAPLLVDFSIGMSDPNVNETSDVTAEIERLVGARGCEVRSPEVRPRNAIARRLYEEGQSITGCVQGGILQAVAFWLTEQREGRLRAARPLSAPRILFLEFLDLGTEQAKLDEIAEAIRSGFLAVNAVVVGYIRANEQRPPVEQAAYHDRVRFALDGMCRQCDAASIPVFEGLAAGHKFPNRPLPFGPAVMNLGEGARFDFEELGS